MKKSHLSELEFQFPSEEAEMPKNANEIIKDYIRNVGSEGITMDEVMEEVKYLPHAFQLRLMMELANEELLVIKNKKNKSEEEYDDDDTMDELPPIKISPKEVEKMWNSKFDIAWDAARNMYDFNMNENKVDYYKDRHGKKFQTVDVNYLQYPGKVMVKYTDSDTPVEYTGNFEADLKSNMIKRLDSEINEAFFIGEDQTITCENCGWEWKLKMGGQDPYTCHKCKHNNSDEVDEYDIDENNPYEIKDFLQFMKEYKQYLSEAQCDCVYEAKYRGREVQLGKPMQGDIKKFKVYVKNNKGKVVKVNFGAHGMNIKRNNPKRRNAYRKRHHCDQPGPRWKANYWSCRKW